MAKPKTPLGNWPHPSPKNRDERLANAEVARKRMEGCILERQRIWKVILGRHAEAKLQEIVQLREQGNQQGKWAIALSKMIEDWEL